MKIDVEWNVKVKKCKLLRLDRVVLEKGTYEGLSFILEDLRTLRQGGEDKNFCFCFAVFWYTSPETVQTRRRGPEPSPRQFVARKTLFVDVLDLFENNKKCFCSRKQKMLKEIEFNEVYNYLNSWSYVQPYKRLGDSTNGLPELPKPSRNSGRSSNLSYRIRNFM